jgi:hypothetical protein
MRGKFLALAAGIAVCALGASTASATLLNVGESGFTPLAPVINSTVLSGLATSNPTDTFSSIPTIGSETLSFDGTFEGQTTAPAADGEVQIVQNVPNNPLTLNTAGPAVQVTTDGSSPTNPILSGTPTFDGPVSILFSKPVAAVGFLAGYLNGIGTIHIQAYTSDGTVLGEVSNPATGFIFYGLEDSSQASVISGVSIFGDDPAGWEINNITFGAAAQLSAPSVPLPRAATTGLTTLAGLGFLAGLRKRMKWATA